MLVAVVSRGCTCPFTFVLAPRTSAHSEISVSQQNQNAHWDRQRACRGNHAATQNAYVHVAKQQHQQGGWWSTARVNAGPRRVWSGTCQAQRAGATTCDAAATPRRRRCAP